jgi:FAD/FMN-containing dehydrogenase
MTAVREQGPLDELRRILPTEQIEPQAGADEPHGGSWAVEPATPDELVDLMRWANQRRAAVYTRHPRPGDAALCGGRPRIYLRGRRMQRMRDIDMVSGTVTVQSGIAMQALHHALAERGYTTGLPTRPWHNESLGAVLAASLDAHWGPRYGSMEEHVMALGVVFPNGSAAHSRVAPRKAVGPDFDRLFLGSRGRYGIIHEVTLRIYPATSRIVLSYGAPDLATALNAVRRAIEAGLQGRAIEVLTPAPDRAWGKKRVGLTDALPVLVMVEPWGSESGRPVSVFEAAMGELLTRLDPPAGWDVHEGLLPPPRAWTEPVVAVRWAELEDLAKTLGAEVPPGLWLVRMSRHGGWLSLASSAKGDKTHAVERLITEHLPPKHGAWDPLALAIKRRLDPNNVLNPVAEDEPLVPPGEKE